MAQPQLKSSLIVCGVAASVLLLSGTSLHAAVFSFELIGSSGVHGAPAATQFEVEVTDAGGGKVDFKFTNIGTIQSTIARIYFADGDWYEDTISITSSTGVQFTQEATPANLPGGFTTTVEYTAGASNPPPHKGVNNYSGLNPSDAEYVIIQWELISGKTYSELLDSLDEGTTRIGLHVINFPNDESHSYATPPPSDLPDPPNAPGDLPEPASLALWGIGLGLMGFGARRRLRKA